MLAVLRQGSSTPKTRKEKPSARATPALGQTCGWMECGHESWILRDWNHSRKVSDECRHALAFRVPNGGFRHLHYRQALPESVQRHGEGVPAHSVPRIFGH